MENFDYSPDLFGGGSLMVQIFGSPTPARSKDDEQNTGQSVSDKQNGSSSTSPVVCSSKKCVPDLSKKKLATLLVFLVLAILLNLLSSIM